MSDWLWRYRNAIAGFAVGVCLPLAVVDFWFGGTLGLIAGILCIAAVVINATNLYQDYRMRRKYGSQWE